MQEKFCEEYIIDYNGARAVRDAGYKTKHSDVIAFQLLGTAIVQEYLQKLSQKDKKAREKRKQKYIEELEKLGFSDLTKYSYKYEKTDDGNERLKIIPEEGADPLTCSTAAIQEISYTKYGPKIKTHDKVTPLLKLLDREDKADELLEDKEIEENDGFIKAINNIAEKVCNNETEEE